MGYLINTPCGQVQGVSSRLEHVVAYKGIRYATAGRWEYPKQVTHWDGVYDASNYGACSYQPRSFYNEEEIYLTKEILTPTQEYEKVCHSKKDTFIGNNDCLSCLIEKVAISTEEECYRCSNREWANFECRLK